MTSERLGLRWVGHDRPGYGGSTGLPGRDVAAVAADVAAGGVEAWAAAVVCAED